MRKRFWRYVILILIVVLLGTILGVDRFVSNSTAGQLYSDVSQIPKNKVGLLLGTAKYRDKGKKIINPYYQNRIDATVILYMAGKIDYIIVSGDNSTVYYDEPELMKADLIARGVPANRIYKDNAGFRTLDSILRCRDIFGLTQVTIISQKFHNQRAVFIANHKNVTSVAYNAADGDSFFDVYFREKLARIKMSTDIIFNKQAKFYGERIEIQ